MGEDFGSTYITIEDEEGNEFELEQLATMEFNGQEYSAFLPADMSEDDPGQTMRRGNKFPRRGIGFNAWARPYVFILPCLRMF